MCSSLAAAPWRWGSCSVDPGTSGTLALPGSASAPALRPDLAAVIRPWCGAVAMEAVFGGSGDERDARAPGIGFRSCAAVPAWQP